MKDYRMKKNLRRLAAALSVAFFTGTAWMPTGRAMPTGGLPTLATGTDSQITTSDNTMTIAKGGDSLIKWDDFSVGSGKTVLFNDNHNYLNYVTGNKMSEILGTINTCSGFSSNIYIINPNGILFGKNATISVGTGALIASTTAISNINTLTTVDGVMDQIGATDIVNMGVKLDGMQITKIGNDITFKRLATNKTLDKITIADDGVKLISNVNSIGTNGKYVLGNDITTPVTAAISGSFSGVFDGAGHTVKLDINQSGTNDVGLFQKINGGTAKNLTLTGSVKGKDNVGALVGQVRGETTISSVYNKANVTGEDNVGGLVGEIVPGGGDIRIENFRNEGTVTGASKVGSIIGFADLNSSGYIIEVDNGKLKASANPWVGYPSINSNRTEYQNVDDTTSEYIKVTNVTLISGGSSSTPAAPSVPSTPIVTPEVIPATEPTPEASPEPVIEPTPEPAATPAATTLALVTESYRSIQDATNAASASASKTDTMESNELLKDKHAGMFMNSTHNVRHVALDEASLARMLQGDREDTGIEFSTEVTGETESTTTELSGFFEGDDVGTVEA